MAHVRVQSQPRNNRLTLAEVAGVAGPAYWSEQECPRGAPACRCRSDHGMGNRRSAVPTGSCPCPCSRTARIWSSSCFRLCDTLRRVGEEQQHRTDACSVSLPPARSNDIPFAVCTNRKSPVFDGSEVSCARVELLVARFAASAKQYVNEYCTTQANIWSSGHAKLLGRRGWPTGADYRWRHVRDIVDGAASARRREVPLRMLFVRTVPNQAVAHSRLGMRSGSSAQSGNIVRISSNVSS